MRKAGKLLWSQKAQFGGMMLTLVLTLGFAVGHFSFVSHAESKGKITAPNSVNIRKEASTSSAKVGSTQKDATVDIRGKVTASDGSVWYQVFVDANTLGYIRSDLVEITDGTTPPTIQPDSNTTTTPTTPTTTTTPATNTNETPTDVTAVEPLSAKVIKSEKVRVRSNASTTSSIVTNVERDFALTVTGTAQGTDGATWYQVAFISNGAEVTGFIRSDYVSLSGDLVEKTEVTPDTTTPSEQPEETTEPEVPEVKKAWDTVYQNEKWYLLNYEKGSQVVIDDLYNAIDTSTVLYEDAQKTISSQKVAIIVLVILFIASAASAIILFMKMKDMADSAYFSEVERETLRRRGEKAQNRQKRVAPTVGPEQKTGARPQGTRPQGAQPQGARPQGAQSQGTRPQGARPQGAQSQGTRPQGTRPQGAQPQGTRPQGTRPQGAQPQGTRPQGVQPQSTRPQSRPAEQAKVQGKPQDPSRKAKNFMGDDDMEIQFLNWDGLDD